MVHENRFSQGREILIFSPMVFNLFFWPGTHENPGNLGARTWNKRGDGVKIHTHGHQNSWFENADEKSE